MKLLLKKYCLVLSCMMIVGYVAAQPINLPIESRPDIYTYFNPQAQNLPADAFSASKAVVHVNSYSADVERAVGTSGSAFLIRTFRADNKICMCLAGHQIADLFPEGGIPIAGSAINLNSDIYMNYLGKDSAAGGNHFDQPVSFSKAFVGSVKLLDYYFDESTEKDAALVLIDSRKLPAQSFVTLGYDFADNAWSSTSFYNIGHPHNYPQRIADQLTMQQVGINSVKFTNQLPYATGPGSSGSPLIIRSGNSGTVRGILSQGFHQPFFMSFSKATGEAYNYKYSTNPQFTKIRILESAIRKHCWNKSDSAAISGNQSYKQMLTVDNSTAINPYAQNYSISGTAGLTASAGALFRESASDIEITRLHAANCSVSGDFSLPVTYPGSTKPWQVEIAAKEINISPGATTGFDYTASGSSELELSSVVIGTSPVSQSTISGGFSPSLPSLPTTADTRFAVFPNPAPDGIFSVAFPDNGPYDLKVTSMDGKELLHTSVTSNPYTLYLPNIAPRGTYVMTVHLGSGYKPVYKTMIVY